MTQQDQRMLHQALEELKLHLMEQGCHTLRDAITRDYVTVVRLVQVMEHLGYTVAQEVSGPISGDEQTFAALSALRIQLWHITNAALQLPHTIAPCAETEQVSTQLSTLLRVLHRRGIEPAASERAEGACG
jgi:hypothetical protein